jgi:hypothetical protein
MFFKYMFTFHSIDDWFADCPVQRGLQEQINTVVLLTHFHQFKVLALQVHWMKKMIYFA